jgi:hypothetical protein
VNGVDQLAGYRGSQWICTVRFAASRSKRNRADNLQSWHGSNTASCQCRSRTRVCSTGCVESCCGHSPDGTRNLARCAC